MPHNHIKDLAEEFPYIPNRIQAFKKFRLPIHRSSLYFLVNIWKSKKDMYAHDMHYRVEQDKDNPFDYEAFVSNFFVRTYDKGKRKSTSKIIGDINFYLAGMTPEVVTHEAFHATLAFFRRTKADFSELNAKDWGSHMELEENMAYVHGHICNHIFSKIHQLKLLK